MVDGKSLKNNPGHKNSDQDKPTFTKLSVNFYGQGKFEGQSLQEVLEKYPKGSKVIIDGEEVALKVGQ